MATDDSTSSDKAAAEIQLEKQYPISGDPFAVWYCKVEGLKWAANNEKGNPIAMAANLKDAAKIAKAFRLAQAFKSGAQAKAIKKADKLSAEASISILHCQPEIRMGTATPNIEERRSGALACVDALRIIDRIAAGDKSEATWEECWQDEDVSITAMQHAAGNHGEFMAGFVAVFAEYAHMFIAGGEPNLYVWKPVASMTDEEIKAERARAEKFAHDDENLKVEEAHHAYGISYWYNRCLTKKARTTGC